MLKATSLILILMTSSCTKLVVTEPVDLPKPVKPEYAKILESDFHCKERTNVCFVTKGIIRKIVKRDNQKTKYIKELEAVLYSK